MLVAVRTYPARGAAVWLLAALAGGCDPRERPDEEPAAELPSSWSYSDDAPAATPLSPAELGVALDAAFVDVLRLDPAVGFDAYDRLSALTDTVCPWYDPTFVAQRYWEDDCETAMGVSFYGWALYNRARDLRMRDMRCDDVGFLYGFSRIENPGQASYAGYGELDIDACESLDGSHASFDSLIRGDFRAQGTGDDDSWLARDLSVALTLSASRDAVGRSLGLSGTVSGLDGTLPWLYFHDLVASSDPSTCTREPAGWVWAMDAAYTTYEVRFDDVGGDDPACDGCGAATAGGVDMGSVCVDVAPLVTWEERPWG